MYELHDISRRELLTRATGGFAALPLAWMLAREAEAKAPSRSRTTDPLAPQAAHFPAKAKAIIYLYMEGGPSQLDTFDYKPALAKHHGQPIPLATPSTVFNIGKKLLKSPFAFKRHGESGGWVSEIFPHVAGCIDQMTIVHSMHHGISNHSSACYKSHTGFEMSGKPSMGAWLTYALGSVCDDLPGFVLLDCGQGPSGGAPSWGSGFLPAAYQGTLFTKNKVPIDNVKRRESTAEQQRRKLEAIARLNRGRIEQAGGDSRLDAMIASYEMAARMQLAVPQLIDFSDESDETKKLYGMNEKQTELFGSRCLLARRLIERGVRFVELFPPRVRADRWDQHSNLADGHRQNAAATDKPVAALLKDLKRRGLLDETIVLWGGEFGRTPNAQGSNGRDHNPFGYTVWLAGGGFKPGIRHGATDDFGYFAVEDKVHLHDLHATILHQMGLDHEKLTYRFSGRDYRLTDVHGHVVRDILG